MARTINLLKNFDHVTTVATSDEGMTTAWAMRFHCWNPNGAYAQLKASHDRLNAWIDAHPERPNGVLFVYGSLSNHCYNLLFGPKGVLELHRKGQAHKWPLQYALATIAKQIAACDKFINDPTEWPDTKEALHAAALAEASNAA